MNKMLRTVVLVSGLFFTAQSGFVLAAEVEGAVYVGKDRVYIDPAKFDSTRYMSPPPVALEAEEDMLAVVRWQERRTAAMAAQTVIDSEQSVFVFADVVGNKFNAANFPKARKFFNAVYRTESHLNKQGKERWARLRPPGQNDQIKPVSRFANQGSYPSGHAAFGWLTGIVQARMQYTCLATTWKGAADLADAVRCGLHGYRGVRDGARIEEIQYAGQHDDYDETTGIYWIPVDMIVTYLEET